MTFAIFVRDPRTREAVIAAVLALPPDVARFAERECYFVGIGATARGLAAPPSRRWLIVLDERDPDAATAGHEIAHAWLGHRGRDVRHERQAATLAHSWGLEGSAADADSCARRFTTDDRIELRCSAADGELRVHCACGQQCLVSRVMGSNALLTECLRCLRRELLDLNELPALACPACGVDAALSMLRDGFPALLAWRFDGARGVLSWVGRGMRGTRRWLRRGLRPLFKVRWTDGDALAVRCGTCDARTSLRIAARGSASRRAVPPSPEEAEGAAARAAVPCPGSQ